MSTSPVELLGPDLPSLARTVPAAPVGTLFVVGPAGGVRVAPDSGFVVVFGRNEPEVHVAVGGGDDGVSRRQGVLRRRDGAWTIANLGRLPLRLPGPRLVLTGHDAALADGYTPVVLRTAERREHLLEVRVAGASDPRRDAADDAETRGPRVWPLSDRERLVLVVLGQRYLRQEPGALPLTWRAVEDELDRVAPDDGWSAKRAEHLVGSVRTRLARTVPGLTREEVGEPVGATLTHRLLVELLATSTLVPSDLGLLGEG